VKKLADSKQIIRNEANKALFSIYGIMKAGPAKENNFVGLVLPYLTNSSNWHIREELLFLILKIIMTSDVQSLDILQLLSSAISLFGDSKEKIRNLALETVASVRQVSNQKFLMESLLHLQVDNEVIGLINQRLEQGMLPLLSEEGEVEIPYY
jgi:hypothetical protein